MTFLSGTLPRIGVGWASLRDLPSPAPAATLEILDVDAAFERIASASGPRLAGGAQTGAPGVLRARDGARAAVSPRDPPRRAAAGGARGCHGRGGRASGRGPGGRRPARAHARRRAAARGGGGVRGGRGRVSRGSGWRCSAPSSRCSRRRRRTSRPRSSARAPRQWNGSWTARACRCTASAPRFARSRGASPTSPTACRRSSPRRSRCPSTAVVLDGEVIALRPDGRPYPFQVSMSRFGEQRRGRRPGRAACRSRRSSSTASISTATTFSIARTTSASRPSPGSCPTPCVSRASRPRTPADAERFLEDALARGHEGVVVKALDAPLRGRAGAAPPG